MPPAPGQEEPLKRMTKIVNSLLARQDCSPFREPVDWRGLELYDYPEIITKMMDLGTVKRRLERGYYQTAHQVAEDIRLIWSNCMTYNADGSDFWLLAKSYARRFEDRYRKVRQEFDVGEDLDPNKSKSKSSGNKASSSKSSAAGSDTGSAGAKEIVSPVNQSSSLSQPSLDARATFGTNLFLLSGMELGHVMTILEVECPEVLENCWSGSSGFAGSEQPQQTKVEIVVDSIPSDIFESLNSYVNSKLAGTNATSRSAGSDDDYMSGNKSKKKRKTM